MLAVSTTMLCTLETSVRESRSSKQLDKVTKQTYKCTAIMLLVALMLTVSIANVSFM